MEPASSDVGDPNRLAAGTVDTERLGEPTGRVDGEDADSTPFLGEADREGS